MLKNLMMTSIMTNIGRNSQSRQKKYLVKVNNMKNNPTSKVMFQHQLNNKLKRNLILFNLNHRKKYNHNQNPRNNKNLSSSNLRKLRNKKKLRNLIQTTFNMTAIARSTQSRPRKLKMRK